MLCVVLLLLGVVQANLRDCDGVTARKLAGRTFTIRETAAGRPYQYTIKVGAGGNIVQKRYSGHAGEWRLGNHNRYSTGDMKEHFTNGDKCGDTPRRADITYTFGNGDKILSASEPSVCYYVFRVQIDQAICAIVNPPTPPPTNSPTPSPLCAVVKANKGVQDATRIWDGIDVRVKRGEKTRDFALKAVGDTDPLCDCVNHCEENDIFVYSTKERKGKVFGRCKCWDLPNTVKKGTVRPKAKRKKRSETYQLGAITDAAKSAIEKGIENKSNKKNQG